MNWFAVSLIATLALCSADARATQQGQQAQNNWKQMDNCAKQAQAAYPEFSAEANAKRDAKLKECLNATNLPPRLPLSRPESR
jgi:hypothetical protein